MAGRKKGFASHAFRSERKLRLIEQVKAVLDEYADYLPLALRQLFYRLVAMYGYPKEESDYDYLSTVTGEMRRARIIPMEVFRDDGFVLESPWWYASVDDMRRTISSVAKYAEADRQHGQERRLLIWCESAGMQPQLDAVAKPYGIRVASSGGTDSITTKHAIAKSLAGDGHPVTILHLGDYDASGVTIYDVLDEDIRLFAEEYNGDIQFVRVALLPEHIEEFDLPTAPPKKRKDGRDIKRFTDNRTVQLEALAPPDLAAVLEAAILERFDMDAYRDALAVEEEWRQTVTLALEESGLWLDD